MNKTEIFFFETIITKEERERQETKQARREREKKKCRRATTDLVERDFCVEVVWPLVEHLENLVYERIDDFLDHRGGGRRARG
jgi:hypothetical protein